jgi:hypothetical protein
MTPDEALSMMGVFAGLLVLCIFAAWRMARKWDK